MAHWKISVKNSGNVACKNKRQRLEKGMFVETSTVSTIIPLGQSREAPMLAQLFMSKGRNGVRHLCALFHFFS